MPSEDRQKGVELFNGTWKLIDSRADDELMVHMAHASAYHWAVAAECEPANRARGEWLLARVYALTGRPEPALHHARACLRWCAENGLGDWDLAFAHEALARALKVAGADYAAEVAAARAVPVADDEDRELLERDLEQLLER
jgi:uncharacterized protein (DUF2126 family)